MFKQVPTGFDKPIARTRQNPYPSKPVPVKTRTRGGGYGFRRVRVQVALENPRVARDIP